MNTLGQFYIQKYQHNNVLISEQNAGELNPLFEIACDHQLQYAGTEGKHTINLSVSSPFSLLPDVEACTQLPVWAGYVITTIL
jgi:hypothetical protein